MYVLLLVPANEFALAPGVDIGGDENWGFHVEAGSCCC